MDIVRRIENAGTGLGEPKKKVVIVDCGEVPESDLEDVKRAERKRKMLSSLPEE